MKEWLGTIVRLIAVMEFALVIALTARMQVFLAVPVMVLAYFGYAVFLVWSEKFDDWF